MFRSSEWLLVGSFVFIVSALFVVAKINACRAFSNLSLADPVVESIQVTIDGAVAKPGTYQVQSGTPIDAVLRKARPKPFANLKEIANQIVESPIHVTVPLLTEIRIQVTGEIVDPVELFLPIRSRICDLKSKIKLTKEADLTYFKKKKMLKNEQVIVVPKKVVE